MVYVNNVHAWFTPLKYEKDNFGTNGAPAAKVCPHR